MSSNIKVKRICQFCQKEFEARTTVTKYCSLKCASRAGKARAKLEKIQASHSEMVKVALGEQVDLSKKEILTVKQAALLLNSSPKAIYNMIDSDRLLAARVSARKIRIRRVDIDRLFDAESPLVDLRPLVVEQPFKIKDAYHMAEIQEKFGISEKALYELIKRYEMPKISKGWYVYVAKKEIEKWLDPKVKRDEG